MEPIVNIPPPILARLLSLELTDGQGASELVPAGLRYDSAIPLRWRSYFDDGSGPNIWTFARELLSEGLPTQPAATETYTYRPTGAIRAKPFFSSSSPRTKERRSCRRTPRTSRPSSR